MIDALLTMERRYRATSIFICCLHDLVLCIDCVRINQARFPFLDEDVIKVLLDIPLWEVTDLDQPSGTGDKKILREVHAISFGLNSVILFAVQWDQVMSNSKLLTKRKRFDIVEE